LYDIQNQYSTGNSNYICGANGILLHQNYPDSAWLPVITNTTTDLNGILHLKSNGNLNPFLLFGNNGIVPKSTNSGINWLQQYVGVSNNIYSGMYSGMLYYSSRYMAVGANGLIIRRYLVLPMDTSWVVIQSGTNKDLKSISYFNRYGWIVGANGTILNSIDTGNTWNPRNSLITNNLNSVSFLDSVTGFAVGDGGVILKTSNGGLETHGFLTREYLNTIFSLVLISIHIFTKLVFHILSEREERFSEKHSIQCIILISGHNYGLII
jgi:photosystem II stability/assembly factor-like uncharacterized protein